MKKRLPKTLMHSSFRDAWKNSRDSKSAPGAPGIDKIHAAVFAPKLDSEILDIRRQLQAGIYQFTKLRLAPVPKKTGGHRIIAVPTIRDRLLQRTVLQALELDPRFSASSPIAYGFTKDRSLADAQRTARKMRNEKPWVLQADIIKFFDRIPRDQLKQLIHKNVRGKAIAEILCSAVDCEIEDVGGKGQALLTECGIKEGLGLRQGMPVSPVLSNLLLKKFDQAIIKQNLSAIRYADDIAIFGTSAKELTGALTFLRMMLHKLKLDIPELEEGGKTILANPSQSIEFLGVEIRRENNGEYILTAPAGKIAKIEIEMKATATLAECVKEGRDLGKVAQDLDSFIIGHRASMAVLDDPKPFMDRLEAAKRKSLENLLIEVIGEKTAKALDSNRRAVLGLQPFP